MHKDDNFTVTKEELKTVLAYKSSERSDPAIKATPNKKPCDEIIELSQKKIKLNRSEHFKNRLRMHYMDNTKSNVALIPENLIVDIWETEDVESLKKYTQEWIHSINTLCNGPVKSLRLNKQHLEDELRRMYLKQFTPRDLKQKATKDINPELPEIESMRPFPEFSAFSWGIEGEKTSYGSIVCAINGSIAVLLNIKCRILHFKHVLLMEPAKLRCMKILLLLYQKIICTQLITMKVIMYHSYYILQH